MTDVSSFDTHLLDALFAARDFTDIYGGMASVHIEWHPYECHWVASADWSDGKEFKTTAEQPFVAVSLLRALLESELAKIKTIEIEE